MQKAKLFSLLLSLLSLMISQAVEAQSYVTPTLDSDDDVCVFLISPDANATYYMWAYATPESGYTRPDGEQFPGGTFTLVGQQYDGTYLYKWERPANAAGMPTGMTISKKNGENSSFKILDANFVNHGVYREVQEQQTTDDVARTGTVEAIATGADTDPLAVLQSAGEHSIFFETPRNGTVNAWPYNGSIGGDHYTGVSFPGNQLTKLGQLSNGNYLYKWTQTVNTSDMPQTVIFSPKADGTGEYAGIQYTNHGYYTNTIKTQTVTIARQYGRAYVTPDKAESNLDALATLNSPEEVSIFLESPDESANYQIWPYDANHNGEYYTDSIAWPGATLTKVGKLQNGNYLYKWTLNSHVTDVPATFILSKNYRTDDDKIYEGGFVNHGYYVESSASGKTTLSYREQVTRQTDGSYSTNRTTFGKRVIYEMNVGSFAGNFQNAAKQLPNLKNLGVDVIWLMPIFERGGSTNPNSASPYAVKDYIKVNPKYGTIADLKDFVSAAHLIGIDVWLDFVPNHTATDNAWATPGSSDFHPEYYTGYNKQNPNDISGFVHPKSGNITYNDVWQLDYNYEDDSDPDDIHNPADRAMRNVLEYWVKNADIDGYRFDMVSSTTIPDPVWNHLTSALKAIKPSIQFLAEADLSGDDGKRITASNFQYDYAWWFNDKLRAFGQSTDAYEDASDTNPTNDPHDLAHITRSFLLGTNNVNVDRMVYLTNHDKNWGDDANGKYTQRDIWGDNRYAMTVYEFTMPGMPLIYNGQEQDGSVKLNYFEDTPIDWKATSDYSMLGLIQELAYLKHTNNALNDGNNATLRGETRLLNAFDHKVLAYERINGDNHVMVVLNLGDNDVSTDILGATPGTWNLILNGSNNGLNNADINYPVSEDWRLENIPAHGYMVFTYTGETKSDTTGIYIVTGEGSQSVQQPMSFVEEDNSYSYYQFTINNSDFASLNPDGGALTFKFQEYYDFLGTVCKKDHLYGAGSNASAQFKAGATRFDFKADADGADNSFSISSADTAGVSKFIVTFVRSKANSDEGYVDVQIIRRGDVEDGYYLLTPININDLSTTKVHQWRFKAAYEDPDAVSDRYIRDLNEDKTDLCSFTIDASQFDSYIPADRKSGNAIQFRIRQYANNSDVTNSKGEITDVCPSTADKDNAKSTFDASKDNASNVYEDAWWEPMTTDDGYFKILYQPDVAKYIIQIWKAGREGNGETRVRVYYVRKFNYAGSTIEDVTASNEDVYLYNVDAQKFLYVGNTWGTMASLLYDDLGTRLNISRGKTDENTEYKLIRTRLDAVTTVPNGTMLGIDDYSYSRNSNDPFINLDSANIYCDRDNGNRWLFEKADTVDYANTYTLRLYDAKDGRFHYMLADHSNGSSPEDKITNTKVKYVALDSRTVYPSQLSWLNGNLQGYAEVWGGNRVVNIGSNIGSIAYTYNAQAAGTYDITVGYIYNSNTTLKVKTDDNEYSAEAPSTGTRTNTNRSKYLTYRVHLNAGDNNITFADQAETSPYITGFSIEMIRPDDLSYGRWQLITYSDLVNKLKNENAELYGGTTADATFLLTDQGFTRNVPVSWNTDRGVNGSTVNFTKNRIGDVPDNGMYWNAHITGKGKVYQDVDVPMYGIYQFDAFGFYNGSPTQMFYQYATAFNADGSVRTWSELKGNTPLKNDPNRTYKDRNTDIETGKLFYNESVLDASQEYNNTQFIYVPQDAPMYKGNYRIRIGFNKTDSRTGDYTAVDDVHLHYNGKATFILDDGWDEQTKDTRMTNDDRTNVPVWLKRKFWPNVWNTLVLPVSVTTTQLRAMFGNDVEVATPYGLDGNDPDLIRFTRVNLTSGSNAIEAGRYYIVKPKKLVGTSHVMNLVKTGDNSYDPRDEKVDDGDTDTKFFNLGSHNLKGMPTTVDTLGINTYNFHAASEHHPEHNTISIVGSFAKTQAPGRSYVFTSKGIMRHIIHPSSMNGFRFYIIDNDNNTPSEAKSLTMGSLTDDLDALLASYGKLDGGDPTGINNVNSTVSGTTDSGTSGNGIGNGDVFDLSGRRVASNGQVDNLPKGVYISNGKKFIKD